MAELVEKKMEEMIPEMEEIERTSLLSAVEVRQLVIKRRHLLYKMYARNPCKVDFVNVIEYEGKLLELLAIRRKNLRMTEKFQEIEKVLLRRQEMLLRFATRRYSDCFDMWAMRLNFAKSIRHVHEVRVAYREMTLKHSRLVSLWLAWADYEMAERKDFQKAREILLSEAPMHHPRSRELRRELFRFELLHVEHLFQGRFSNDSTNEGSVQNLSEPKQKVFQLEAARLVYRKITQEHDDACMALWLYHIAHKFIFAMDLREEIYSDILKRFDKTPDVMVLKAERAALKLPTEASTEGDEEHEKEENHYLKPYQIYARARKEKAQQVGVLPVTSQERTDVLSTYLETLSDGLSVFAGDSDDMQVMLSLYCSQLTGLLYHVWNCSLSTALIAQHYTDTCARHKHLLQPRQLFSWASMLEQFPGVASPWSSYAVLQEAVSMHPSHEPTLVYVFQNIILQQDMDSEAIIKEYYKISGILSPAWQRVAHKLVTSNLSKGPDRAQFLSSQCHAPADNQVAKGTRLALLWSQYQDNDLDAARQVYSKYQYVPPLFDQLHSTMSIIELYGVQQQKGDEACDSTEISNPGSTSKIITKNYCNLSEFSIDRTGDGVEHAESDDESEAGDKKQEIEESTDDECTITDNNETQEDSDDAEVTSTDDEDGNNDSSRNGDSSDETGSSGYDEGSEEEEEESECEDEMKFELCRRPDLERIRNIFKVAVRQSKGKHHDVWMAYVQFELRFGSALESGKLTKQAERDMEPWSLQAFRDMMMDIRDQRFVDAEENEDSTKHGVQVPEQPVLLSCLQPNYCQPPSRGKLSNRTAFFRILDNIDAHLNKEPACPAGLGVSWHDVLTLLLDGHCVKPRLQQLSSKTAAAAATEESKKQKAKDTTRLLLPGELFYRNKYKQFKGSDKLQVTCSGEGTRKRLIAKRGVHDRDDMEAKLAKSDTLKPEFIKKTEVGQKKSFRHLKKIAKEERKKTAGKSWQYMKAPEMTEELKQNIELLKMRGILDPKQRFKTTHMKHTPKYFQVGTIMDDPRCFYSSRMTKKERKATFVEQIMNDQQIVSYQKRKYGQLVSEREANRRLKKKRKTGVDYIKV